MNAFPMVFPTAPGDLRERFRGNTINGKGDMPIGMMRGIPPLSFIIPFSVKAMKDLLFISNNFNHVTAK